MLTTLWTVLMLAVAQNSPQTLPPPRTSESLRVLPPFAAAPAPAAGQTELTVRWIVAAPTGQPPPQGALIAPQSVPEVNQFDVLRRRAIGEAPVRERNPQVGPDELVVVAVDASGREVAWQHVKDPRIVRSEQPGPGGLLSGQVLYRRETELVIRVPDSLSAAFVRVYEVQWNGSEFSLRGLGTVSVR